MTTGTMTPVPATELVKNNAAGFANESAAYRKARNSLLAEEIELQRRIDAVAEQR